MMWHIHTAPPRMHTQQCETRRYETRRHDISHRATSHMVRDKMRHDATWFTMSFRLLLYVMCCLVFATVCETTRDEITPPCSIGRSEIRQHITSVLPRAIWHRCRALPCVPCRLVSCVVCCVALCHAMCHVVQCGDVVLCCAVPCAMYHVVWCGDVVLCGVV